MVAQNNAIRTNYDKIRINKTQQNRKYRLCGEKNEMINLLVSKCPKLTQKEYKARHNLVGKLNH